MSYFSNVEGGLALDGPGCGPSCNCGPCRSDLIGLGERYEKEDDGESEKPAQAAAKSEPQRLNGWGRTGFGLGYLGYRSGGALAGAPWPPRLQPRCYGLDLTVPNTYAELEEAVRRWISTCVMARTEVQPGVPIRRERALVNGNATLRSIWDRVLQYLKGRRVRIAAQYTWGPNREESINFSTTATPPPTPVAPPVPAPVRIPCPPPTCSPVGPFLPSTHGFKFPNSFSLTVPLPPPFPAIGGGYGLCGGMASAVLDYYLSCIPIPSTSSIPGFGNVLHNYLLNRLLDSLGRPVFGMVAKFLSWTQRPDVTSNLTLAAARALGPAVSAVALTALGPAAMVVGNTVTVDGVQELTVPEFRGTVASITAGRMVVLGLVYQGPGTLNIWDNHQVLAYGLRLAGPTVTDIKIYDPNYPGRDDIAIHCELVAGGTRVRCVEQIGGLTKRVRGFFPMPYSRRTPPCLP